MSRKLTVEDVVKTTLSIFTDSCIEMAKENWNQSQVEMLDRLFSAVIADCPYKCVDCTYLGRPADAPDDVLGCLWNPSEEDGYSIPCEDE